VYENHPPTAPDLNTHDPGAIPFIFIIPFNISEFEKFGMIIVSKLEGTKQVKKVQNEI
jgi:hypothetical protein